MTVALLQMAVIAPVCYAVARPKLEWGIARGTAPLALVNVLNVVSGLIGELCRCHLEFIRGPMLSVELASPSDVVAVCVKLRLRLMLILSLCCICRHGRAKRSYVHSTTALHACMYHYIRALYDGKEA